MINTRIVFHRRNEGKLSDVQCIGGVFQGPIQSIIHLSGEKWQYLLGE